TRPRRAVVRTARASASFGTPSSKRRVRPRRANPAPLQNATRKNAKFSYRRRFSRRYKVRAACIDAAVRSGEAGVTAVKFGRMFIGKHTERARPVNPVDENLMRRIAEAKQRLIERNIEPVALLRVKPTSRPTHAHR